MLRAAIVDFQTDDILKAAKEALWWMQGANEPDDKEQTKEQFRLAIIDSLSQAIVREEGEVIDMCGLCGHDIVFDACGDANVTSIGGEKTHLCHTDDHSCYVAWTVYQIRTPEAFAAFTNPPHRSIKLEGI